MEQQVSEKLERQKTSSNGFDLTHANLSSGQSDLFTFNKSSPEQLNVDYHENVLEGWRLKWHPNDYNMEYCSSRGDSH